MAPTLEDVMRRLSDIEREVRLLRQSERPIPAARKYSYAEAAFRITHGEDPARLGEEERAALEEKGTLSRDVVGRLTRDGDCPLRRVQVGGNTYVTERSIQHYEQGISQGWVKGYQIPESRKYRRDS